MTTLPISDKQKQSSKWRFVNEQGRNVLPDAAVFQVSVSAGGKVVSEPIEKGSFMTYNKVTSPLEINADLSFSGTNAYLQSVIDTIDALKQEISYFSVVTPVYEYEHMTLQNYDYSLNAADGLGVLHVNAQFIEIREVDVAYSTADVSTITAADAKNPSDASTVNTGTTTPAEPTAGQQEAGEHVKKKSILAGALG
jgi:hypothetical protein